MILQTLQLILPLKHSLPEIHKNPFCSPVRKFKNPLCHFVLKNVGKVYNVQNFISLNIVKNAPKVLEEIVVLPH
jgi:hypothetical protein